MDRRRGALVVLLAAALASCRTGRPLLDSSTDNDNAPGTIAGIVTAGGEPVAGRRVEAVQVVTARKYTAVTNVAGGFSMAVPPGKYRLEVTLLEGEKVTRQPGVIDINESDVDANLEIVLEL
jgi:hypothetical protein